MMYANIDNFEMKTCFFFPFFLHRIYFVGSNKYQSSMLRAKIRKLIHNLTNHYKPQFYYIKKKNRWGFDGF